MVFIVLRWVHYKNSASFNFYHTYH